MSSSAFAALSRREQLRNSWRGWWDSHHQLRGPQWLQWMWTVVFSLGLGAIFTVFGFISYATKLDDWLSLGNWWKWFWRNAVVCLCIGLTIHLLHQIGARVLGQARVLALQGWRRSAYYALIPIVGVLLGWPIGYWMIGKPWGDLSGARGAIAWTILISALITLFFQLYWSGREREAAAQRRATEAQLRLLQGQMEPHFMFNTLGTVLALIESDAPKARRMLEAFIDYLRASLGKLRSGDSTLGDELALTEAYLSLMQHRMGERLSYRVHIADPALRDMPLPPLLLQPLVENAIHHGLECKVEGGNVAVNARAEGGRLVLEVIDDGLGACERPVRRVGAAGNGVALKNLRARLASRYGDRASLNLDLQPDAGARATLALPLAAAAAAAAI
jgi:Histidine kinase